MPTAVDMQTDADVLPRLVVEVESPTRLDDDGRRVRGLGPDFDDLAAQLAGGPQRIREVQIVVGKQWCGQPSRRTAKQIELRTALPELPTLPVPSIQSLQTHQTSTSHLPNPLPTVP